MPATVNGGGDQLARGAVSARFRASDTVSQARWDAIFGADSGPKANYAKTNEPKKRVRKVKKTDSK
jgi:hypothetical protein